MPASTTGCEFIRGGNFSDLGPVFYAAAMQLGEVLNVCQYSEHSDDWVRIPNGAGDRLLTGFVDVSSSSDEPPALAVLQPSYHAAYVPDPSITLAWGFDAEDSLYEESDPPEREDWQPDAYKTVSHQTALVLYNGATAWQVVYASTNYGSGVDMAVPWPYRTYERHSEQPTFWTTRWEVEFAYLLSHIQRDIDTDLIPMMTKGGVVEVRDIDPITARQLRM